MRMAERKLTAELVREAGIGRVDIDRDGESRPSLAGLMAFEVREPALARVVRSRAELDALAAEGKVDAAAYGGCTDEFFEQLDLLLVEFDYAADPARMRLLGAMSDFANLVACVLALPDYRRDLRPARCSFAKSLPKDDFYHGRWEHAGGVHVVVANAFVYYHGAGVNSSAMGQAATDVFAPGFDAAGGAERDYAGARLSFVPQEPGPDGAPRDAAGGRAASAECDEYGRYFAPNAAGGLYRVDADAEGVSGRALAAVCPMFVSYEFDLVDPEG